jgi:hypothetical protein
VGTAVASILLVTTLLLATIIILLYHVGAIKGKHKNRYTRVLHIDGIHSYCFIPYRVDHPSDNVDLDLVKCGAYEVVKLSRQRIAMNDNPAYGEIGVGVQPVLH